MKKKSETIIETHQIQIIRRRNPEVWGECVACSAKVNMITPEAAAVLAQVTARTICRWIEAGDLHFIETPEGALLICKNSIMQKAQVPNPANRQNPKRKP